MAKVKSDTLHVQGINVGITQKIIGMSISH